MTIWAKLEGMQDAQLVAFMNCLDLDPRKIDF